MKIKKFKYKKDGSITDRELLVVRETTKKGKKYLEGFCLSSVKDKTIAESLREAAPRMILLADDKIGVESGAVPDIKAAMSCWRLFSLDQVVG